MTVEVLVRSCRLTIVRSDGWSWGTEPNLHIDAAMVGVEAAIQAAVADRTPAAPDVVVHEPLRITVRADRSTSAAARVVADAIARVEATAGAAPTPLVVGADATATDAGDQTTRPFEPEDVSTATASMAATLAAWWASGRAVGVLAMWSPTQVRRWLRATERMGSTPGTAVVELPEATIRAIVGSVITAVRNAATPIEVDRVLLATTAALTTSTDGRLPGVESQRRCRAIIVDALGLEVEVDAHSEADPGAPAQVTPPDDARAPAESGAAALATVVPAMPFLVLDQLARIGYLDAVTGAAAAAELVHGPLGIIAAIAGKSLSAPIRGWLRDPATADAVRLAIGGFDTDINELLGAVTRAGDDIAAALASTLLMAYADGRSGSEPVAMLADARGRLIAEGDTALPISWVGDADRAAAVLTQLGDPGVVEHADLEDLADALGERRAMPRIHHPALERHLGAAVGTALGLLTLTLWPDQSHRATLCAIDRLADLECRVGMSDSGLHVGLPHGQRWLDFQRAGLLRATRLGWMPGGVMEIGSW